MQTSIILEPPPKPPDPRAGSVLVQARDLTRIWGTGDAAATAVDRVDLDLQASTLR